MYVGTHTNQSLTNYTHTHTVLNKLRERKGMNTFTFRPHCGESGDVMHCASAYMLVDGISHGVNLNKNPTLEYLFYLDQIGIAVPPTSNNFLFLKLKNNPFDKFFRRGLNVSISTDDPMLFHLSHHPLLEEYSICRQFWSYSITDLSEIAHNSCLQSGFPHSWKLAWLGSSYWLPDHRRNDPDRTNVPMVRARFRGEAREFQRAFVGKQARGVFERLKGASRSSFDVLEQLHHGAAKKKAMEERMGEMQAEIEELKNKLKLKKEEDAEEEEG